MPVLMAAIFFSALSLWPMPSIAQDCTQLERLNSNLSATTLQRERSMRSGDRQAFCAATSRGLDILGDSLAYMRRNVGRCGINENTISQVAGIAQSIAAEQQRDCRPARRSGARRTESSPQLNGLPTSVSGEVRKVERICRQSGGQPAYEPLDLIKAVYMGAVGPGREAFLIDYSAFQCQGGNEDTALCGTGGCPLTLLLPAGGGKWSKAAEWLVTSWEQIGAKADGSNVRLKLTSRGNACGKANYEQCDQLFRADGGTLLEVQ